MTKYDVRISSLCQSTNFLNASRTFSSHWRTFGKVWLTGVRWPPCEDAADSDRDSGSKCSTSSQPFVSENLPDFRRMFV